MEPLQQSDPTQVGAYELRARLGAGGMGRVYLGVSPGGRKVAVKVVRPEFAAHPGFRRRFAREVEAARRVGGFHTAQIVDADPEADAPWLASAYIPGPSLREQVRAHGPLTPDATRALAAGLAEGLAAIHACGLVHRDLNPGNVILADDGPRIIDFGVAHIIDATAMTTAGVVVGTFAFMSPEQVNAARIDAASDVFSLGSVLGFAANGRGPFDADTVGAIMHRILSQPPDLGALPGDLREAAAACLAKTPADRPSAVEVLARLRRPVTPAADQHAPDTTVRLAGAGDDRALLAPTVVDGAQAQAPTPPGAGGDRGPFGVRRRALLLGSLAGVAAAGAGTGLTLWATAAGRHRLSGVGPGRALSAAGTAVLGLAFSPDGGRVAARCAGTDLNTTAVAMANGVVHVWNVTTGQLTGSFNVEGLITTIGYAYGGGTLVVDGAQDQLGCYDTASYNLTATPDFPGYVWAMALSRDGRTLAAAGTDQSTCGVPVGFYDFASGRLRTVRLHSGDNCSGGNSNNSGNSNSSDKSVSATSGAMAFSPDSTAIALAAGDQTIRIWDVATGQSRATFAISSAVNVLAYSPDGSVLVSAGDGVLTWWPPSGGGALGTLRPAGLSDTLCFTPDGGTLATATGTGAVQLWNPQARKLITTVATPSTSGVHAVCFSPDGNTLAVGGAVNGVATLWLHHVS